MKKIFILIVLIIIGFWLFKSKPKETPKIINQLSVEQKPIEQEKCVSTDYQECKEFPWLDLPLKYFSVKDIDWGSAGGSGKEGTMEKYTQAALDNKAVYQSYPTTITTIKQYSSEVVPITSKKFSDVRKEILKTEDGESSWMKAVDENYKEYGQLAVHFLANFQDIEMSDSFDVDNDGIKEKIVGLNSVGRANGGSYSAAIIKNNKVIFTADEDESFIVFADTPNGFYVQWRSPKDKSARCCPMGYIRTRFIYDGEKFIPLYEQEVRYVVVGKK